jgi:O-antigen ligase
MSNFWYKTRENIQIVFLILFAFSASFSISISQTFFFLSLVVWLIDLILYRKIKKNLRENFSEKLGDHEWENSKNFYLNYPKVIWLPIFGVFFAWAAMRLMNITLSQHPVKELIQARELWLMFIVPLVTFRIQDNNKFQGFLLAFFLGSSITGFYNLLAFFKSNFDPIFRANSFKSFHHLTYAGVTGMVLFIAIGFTLSQISRKRILHSLIYLILTIGVFIGFFLTKSRGGFIALFVALPFLLLLLLRKKFIFILPLILIIPLLVLRHSPRLQDIFEKGFSAQGKEHASLTERIQLWQAGLRIWIHHPMLGTGDADYKEIYQQFRSPEATGVAQDGSHQHNDLLNSLVLYGSLGFSIFILFFISPVYIFYKNHKMTYNDFSDPEAKYLILGSVASIVMFVMMGTSQCHFTDEEVQTVLWIVIGIFFRSNLRILDRNVRLLDNKNNNSEFNRKITT